jgi:CoA:oxalate CoA-transferase
MQPLEGVRVLAVEQYLAGPFGSALLADFGAEIIKVEPPWGDPYRSAQPVFRGEQGEMSYAFGRVNRNKNSVVLRLDEDGDRERFLGLVETADVVWENFRPGVFERLGLSWETLHGRNKGIIYASISGFGHSDLLASPYHNRPAFDIVAQALSGLMTKVGSDDLPPMYLGVPMADTLAGTMAAFGVALALQARAKNNGEGQRVDISMYDVMIALNEQSISYYSRFKKEPPRGASPTSAPYGVFECMDGWFVLGVSSDALFAKFCKAIDAPELASDERLATGVGRSQFRDSVLNPRIGEWASELTGAQACEILNAAGIPAAPVQTVADLFHDPHVAARRMLLTIEDPILGTFQVAGNPIKLSSLLQVPARPSPVLGRDQQRYLPASEGDKS